MCVKSAYRVQAKSTDDGRSFYQSHLGRRRKIEKHFMPKIANCLKKQIRDFVAVLDEKGYEQAKLTINSVVNHQELSKVIKRLYHKTSYIESNYTLGYLRSKKKSLNQKFRLHNGPVFGIGFDELAPIIDRYFDIYLLNKSSIPITEYTKKLIRKFLISKVDAGHDMNQAIQAFKELAVTWTGKGGKADIRAKGIAAMESTRSISFGGLIGAYMSGVDLDKVWVTSEDERVRGASAPAAYPHTVLDLKKAPLMGAFYNGENIKFPGDPDASIDNTAGCRCAMYFEEKPEPKPSLTRILGQFLNDIILGFIGELIVDQVANNDNV